MDKRIYINSMAGISPSMALRGYDSTGEPDYKEYITDAGLRRRMSRIIKMGVASALMCINDAQTAGMENLDGIITGTGWGCLTDTEKFLVSILENNERMLNPTSFIQSTSNTIGAQVALLVGEKNYNNTFVHGGTSFEASMLDAMLKLQDDDSTNILVGGIDEMTSTKNHLLGRMGVWRSSTPGEGSHFFMFSSDYKKTSIAEVISVKTFHKKFTIDTFDELQLLLAKENYKYEDFDKVLCGEQGMDRLLPQNSIPVVRFKKFCGEYPTASAYALWLACNMIETEPGTDGILILNRHLLDQLSLIIIKRANL